MFRPSAAMPCQLTEEGFRLLFEGDGPEPEDVIRLTEPPTGLREQCRAAAARFLALEGELAKYNAAAKARTADLNARLTALHQERARVRDGDVEGIAERLAALDDQIEHVGAELRLVGSTRKPLAEMVEAERPRAERAAKKVAALAYAAQREALQAKRAKLALGIARVAGEDLKELANVVAALGALEGRDPNQSASIIHGWSTGALN